MMVTSLSNMRRSARPTELCMWAAQLTRRRLLAAPAARWQSGHLRGQTQTLRPGWLALPEALPPAAEQWQCEVPDVAQGDPLVTPPSWAAWVAKERLALALHLFHVLAAGRLQMLD